MRHGSSARRFHHAGRLLLAATLFASTPAGADEPKPPAPSPAKTAVSQVADALAAALRTAAKPAFVASAPLQFDGQAPRGAALATLIATQAAGRFGDGARAAQAPGTLAAARENARAFASLVWLAPVLSDGKLRVAADVIPVPATVWAAARDPEPGPIDHAFVEAPFDAEVRSYLAPIPLALSATARAQNFENDVVALACGDLDGDGAHELVSVSRRRVSTLRLRGGKVVLLRSKPWSELAKVHPTPLREPIAFANLGRSDGRSFVDVALSDRAESLRIDASLDVLARFSGLAVPTPSGSACTLFGPSATPSVSGFFLAPNLAACAPGDVAAGLPKLLADQDTLAALLLITPDGSSTGVWASRSANGDLSLFDARGAGPVQHGVGAQLALADLDQDGAPELLTTLDVASPERDAVVIFTWLRKENRVVERARLPVAAGVRALAACPPDGPGQVPFAVATADEVWLVR